MPERVCGSKPSIPRTSDFEERDLTPAELRQLISDEISCYQRYEVEMQRRPSLISDGRGPALVGIAPAVPVRTPGARVTESDESAKTTEATMGKARSSANPLASPRPAVGVGESAGSHAKRARSRAPAATSAPAGDEAEADGEGGGASSSLRKRSRR